MITDRLQSWFGRNPAPRPKKAEPEPVYEDWARPLADEGKIDRSHLYLIGEIKKTRCEHPEAVLEAAAGLTGRESTKTSWDIYRLANQSKDGAEVARALKAYQTVLNSSDALSPTRRETLFLTMFKLHQTGEQALQGYQSYLAGEGSPDEKLLGDLCTFNPSYGQFQSAETIFETFEFAKTLSPEDRKLFLSIHEAHGLIANPEDLTAFRKVWDTACQQPDRAAALADFHTLRQRFADKYPPRPDDRPYDKARTYTGFAARVFSEERELLPLYLKVWGSIEEDSTTCSRVMGVLRERIANGQASATMEDAVAVSMAVKAAPQLSRMMSEEDLSWLTGFCSARDYGLVSSALVEVGTRSQPSLDRLITNLRQISKNATPEQRGRLAARLREVCTNAKLFDGDADLSLEEVAAERRGITVTDNRVQVGSVSLKRRDFSGSKGSNPAGSR